MPFPLQPKNQGDKSPSIYGVGKRLSMDLGTRSLANLCAFRSHPRVRSSLLLIEHLPLGQRRGDKRLRNVPPLLNLGRRVDHDLNLGGHVRQRGVNRCGRSVPPLVGFSDNQQVKVAIGAGVAAGTAAEEDYLQRIDNAHDPADGFRDDSRVNFDNLNHKWPGHK